MAGTALVTGSGGLIGSEAVRHFVQAGYRVIGIENDMRREFFGDAASTEPMTARLVKEYGPDFLSLRRDIRDDEGLDQLFLENPEIELVVHTAAQPSHDWAASAPKVDFHINATGTLNLLEATRQHCPDATFIYCSTSKVYGDQPNKLPLLTLDKRYDLDERHPFYNGITPDMSIDQCLHSLFGASKASADLIVQEYGRYFDMPTVCFRPGCLTGPGHAGTMLHGFLSYLMRCTLVGEPYTIFGYDGRQVRCNIHSADLLDAFHAFHRDPKPGAVYNIGGGRQNACSMLEAIEVCERISGRDLDYQIVDRARIGDHRWWISDLSRFQRDYPEWEQKYDLPRTMREIHDENFARWTEAA